MQYTPPEPAVCAGSWPDWFLPEPGPEEQQGRSGLDPTIKKPLSPLGSKGAPKGQRFQKATPGNTVPQDLAISSGRGWRRGPRISAPEAEGGGRGHGPTGGGIKQTFAERALNSPGPWPCPQPHIPPCIVGGQAPLHHLEPHRWRCTFCIDADTEHTRTHAGAPRGHGPTGSPGLSRGCR